MIDNLLIFLSSLMISLILAIISLDSPYEYNIIIGIIATTGTFVAIFQFIRNRR
jgi:hypothetical protein